MSETQQNRSRMSGSGAAAAQPHTYPGRRPDVTGWVGWVFFAGLMMITLGAFHALAGLVALFNSDFYVVTSDGLVVSLDYTAWGWLHLVFGVLLVAVGVAVMRGQTWGRMAGIAIAIASALVNLLFLAAYPVWSTIAITLDVIVIYALSVHGAEAKALNR
jgi:hypothetical protein